MRTSVVITLSGYSNICLSDASVKPFLKIFSDQKIQVSLWPGTVYENELITGDLVTSASALVWQRYYCSHGLLYLTSLPDLRSGELCTSSPPPLATSAQSLEGKLDSGLGRQGDPAAKRGSLVVFFWQLIPVCRVKASPSKQLAQLSKNCQILEPVTDFLVHNKILVSMFLRWEGT